MKANKNVLNQLLFAGAIGLSIFALFFVVTCTWIGFEVKSLCRDAKSQYREDCTQALIALLNDKTRGYRSRNSAIWALGQLGDNRALPILQSFYTGKIPEREPLDKTISQHELRKAINLAGGGFNATAVFWHYGRDD
jgi:hypothetical protein